MTPPNAARWAQLAPQVDALLTLPRLDRARALDELAANDPQTAAELRALLDARDAASRVDFLQGVADPAALPPTVSAGQALGAWTLVEPIGQGGMGSVWRARRSDGRYEGESAIKLLHTGLFDAAAQERFRREGAILARVHHPGIAQLLDAGLTAQGQPYLVLELVQGEPIDQWCQARALATRQRVELFLQVLDAVAAAHGQLVIHRDLKPSNILVDGDGRVKLLDFGIARLLPGADDDGAAPGALTREGSFALTPRYAAPEQFEGGLLSTATDVYALGVVLYELLAGLHPSGLSGQSGDLPLAYLQAARAAAPRRASERAATPVVARALRDDLDNILARALKVDPAERYATVSELRDDLQRHLRREPVRAQAPSLGYRLAKLLQRRPLESGLVLALAVAVTAGLAATGWQLKQVEQQRALAVQQRERAERMLARSMAADGFTQSVLTELAELPGPVRFADVVARGEKLAAVEGAPDLAGAQALLGIAGFYLSEDEQDKAVQAAERAALMAVRGGDPGLAQLARCAQGQALAGAGRVDEGRNLAEAALQGAEDAQVRQGCHTTLGFIAQIQADGPRVVEQVDAALRAQAELPSGGLRRRSELLALRASGYSLSARHAEADSDYAAVLDELKSLGRADSLDASANWNNWAQVAWQTGQVRLYAERLQQALRIQTGVLGLDHMAAALMTNYARACLSLDQLDDATLWAERGVARAKVSGDALGVVYGNMTLANVARVGKRFALARERLAQARQALGTAGPGAVPRVAIELAEVRVELAEGHGERALARIGTVQRDMDALARSSGTPSFKPTVRLRNRLHAEALAAVGKLPEALVLAHEAVALARGEQGRNAVSAETGETLLELAGLEQRAGDQAAAVRDAAEAAQMLGQALGPEHSKALQARRIASL